MQNMPSYIPEQWQPSGEADRIVPDREIFRNVNNARPHTPDALSMQLANSFPVAMEAKHGRATWVHTSLAPNLIDRVGGEKGGDVGGGGGSQSTGLSKARLRDLKHKLQAAAYGRGDVEDTDDDWEELFELYDSDGSGQLEFDEFRQVIRKAGRVSVRNINDIELRQVFQMVDVDGSGEIDGRVRASIALVANSHTFAYYACSRNSWSGCKRPYLMTSLKRLQRRSRLDCQTAWP